MLLGVGECLFVRHQVQPFFFTVISNILSNICHVDEYICLLRTLTGIAMLLIIFDNMYSLRFTSCATNEWIDMSANMPLGEPH